MIPYHIPINTMIPPTNAFPLNTMIRKIAIPQTNALLSFLHILPVKYTLSAVDPVLGHRNVKLHAPVFLTFLCVTVTWSVLHRPSLRARVHLWLRGLRRRGIRRWALPQKEHPWRRGLGCETGKSGRIYVNSSLFFHLHMFTPAVHRPFSTL